MSERTRFINVNIIITIIKKMTTILKPALEKIMSIFYKDKNECFHLRELSRRTGLYGQSITRSLNLLEKEKYVHSQRKGNLRNYSTTHNKKVYAIFTLLDINKFEKLPPQRKQAIETYFKNLRKQPVYALLFGSTAKENYSEASDMDIFLITNQKIETKNAEKEVDALHAIKISTFQMTQKEFLKELKQKDDKVLQSAIHTGYPLLNHIKWYEETKVS